MKAPRALPRSGIALAVVLVLVALLAVMQGVRWRQEVEDLERQRASNQEAVGVAEEAANLMLGLGAKNGAASLEKLRGLAAGDFADEVDVLADTVAGVLRQGGVESRGKVTAAGLESGTSQRASVLVAATSLVSNTELPRGELRTFRIVVHVESLEGEWKVSDMEFLS